MHDGLVMRTFVLHIIVAYYVISYSSICILIATNLGWSRFQYLRNCSIHLCICTDGISLLGETMDCSHNNVDYSGDLLGGWCPLPISRQLLPHRRVHFWFLSQLDCCAV